MSLVLILLTPGFGEAQQWDTVESWDGSGSKETRTVKIDAREWLLSWSATNEAMPGAGLLQIFVYRSGGSLEALPVNQQGEGSDVSYVHARPGRFYLQINSANLEWEVDLQVPR